MTREIFADMLNGIDDALLIREDRERGGVVGRALWPKLAAVAACLVLVAAVAVPTALYMYTPDMVTGYSDGTASCYATPMAGEYFCFSNVNEARERYKGRDVTFLLAMDIFGDGETLTEEELDAEYQRLTELGYKFYLVEDHWTYYGKGEKQYIPTVVGVFTEEQLADFDVNPEYGYMFRFETNGDGSAVSVDESDIITDFKTDHT